MIPANTNQQLMKGTYLRLRSLQNFIHAIWLFTLSDLKTIVFPSTFFAVICALSGSVPGYTRGTSSYALVKQVAFTAFWAWINLLPFAIANQRQTESIKEDAINKSWRSLPSRRVTQDEAVWLMLTFYLIALLSSSLLGGLIQCMMLIGLGFWYNELKGADNSWIIRNLINACGYMCFLSGGLEVISDSSLTLFRATTCHWLVIVWAVIFTTIQSQDLPDQNGDSMRKRRTMPLVIGDTNARLIITIAIGIWSLLCPAFWQTGSKGFVAPLILGVIVAVRFFKKRSAKDDKTSFRLYNLWIVSLFALPLLGGEK